MSSDLLVTAQWLNEHLDDDGVKVLDCTTLMTPQPVGPSKIESGRATFDEGHIPGAQYVHMVDDLSDPDGEFPYTLPQPEQLGALLGRLGIRASDHVVLYTTGHPMTVTRAWYVLRAVGHERLSVLDGGYLAWVEAGLPVSTDQDDVEPVEYDATRDDKRYASRDDVAAAIDDDGTLLINALSAEQHAGTGGAHYGRPGRIPSSVSVPMTTLLEGDGRTFKQPQAIREQFEQAGLHPGKRAITYCGGGIAATVDAFALALIGHDDWAVYDNSLLQWSADESNPMDRD